MNVRIAVLQLNPKIGAVASNISRANRILGNLTKPVDLLVLPEFAFTGYNFQSQKDLEPYLEPTSAGPSSDWAKTTSKRLNCHTIVGYPELCSTTQNIYNSAVLMGPDGHVIHNFRKAFLYMIDEQFGAKEGPKGFECVSLPTLKDLKLQVGICMDINPYKFEAPFEKFEFSSAAKENEASLVVVPMCWTHSLSPSVYPEQIRQQMKDELEHEMDPSEVDINSVNYWLKRSMPLLESDLARKTCYVAADRCGWEDQVLYAGSSSIITFKGGCPDGALQDRFEYHGSLAQLEENILYQEVVL